MLPRSMKVFKSAVIILWSVMCVPSALLYAQCTSAPTIYPKMGVNLDGISNYGSARIFTDFTKEGNLRNTDFGSYSGGFNANGWPNTSFLLSLMEGNALSPQFYGLYKVKYKGAPSDLQASGIITNKTSTGGYTYADLSIDNSDNKWLVFDNAIDELVIIPEILNGKATGYTFENFPTFNPAILSEYNNFNLYRFMDWGNSNGNTVVEWNERTHKNGVQAKETGVAYEYMIELCNKTNKDMWVNIPVMADDDYILQLSKLIRDSLRSDRNVWIEYGNEIWNTGPGFKGYYMNNVNAANRASSSSYWNNLLRNGLGGYDAGTLGANCSPYGFPSRCPYTAYYTAVRFHALRTKEISDMFAQQWGQDEINNRVRVVFGGQVGYGGKGHGYNIELGLHWLQENGWNPKDHIYAIAAAPYFNINPQDDGVVNSKNTMLNHMSTNIDSMFLSHAGAEGNQIEGWAGISKYFGLKMVAYEGGPDLDYTTGWTPAKRDVKKDLRMTELCKKYWNYWYAYGDDGQFNLFAGGFSKEYKGLYSWKEYSGDDSPVSQAVDYITQTPNPTLTAGHTIPGMVDARKVYGWAICGDIYPCGYGQIAGPMMDGKLYLHGGEISYLLSSNTNAAYQIEIERECGNEATGEVWLDGAIIGTYTLPATPSTRQFYTLTINGTTNVSLNYGVHVLTFKFTSENCNFYRYRFTQGIELAPAAPPKPQGRISICDGGERDIKYTVPQDGSACKYQWSISGSNFAFVGDTNSNQLTLNYLSGFTSAGISVRAFTPGGGYGNWSPVLTITNINCGFQGTPQIACLNTSVDFLENTGTATTWDWDFGDDNSTVSGINTSAPGVFFSTPGKKTIRLVINKGLSNEQSFVKYDYIEVLPEITGDAPVFLFGNSSSQCQAQGSLFYIATVGSGVINYSVLPSEAGTINLTTGKLNWIQTFTGIVTVTAKVLSTGCGSTTPGSAIHVITVNSGFPPGIDVDYSAFEICAGQVATFTASPNLGASSPSFQWRVDGIPVGLNQNIYTNTFTGNATVDVIMTSTSSCGSLPVTSTGITLVVSANGTTPGVSIASINPFYCQGETVSFRASATNAGVNPNYAWYVNGVKTATGVTFSGSNIPSNSEIYAVVSVNGSGCFNTVTGISNRYTLTFIPKISPSVNISGLGRPACEGTPISITATGSNTGAFPIYNWYVNNVYSTSGTTFAPILNNNAAVKVVLSGANGTCLNNTTAVSGIVATVNPNLSPTLSIQSSVTTICAQDMATVTATGLYHGTNPQYQFLVNNSNPIPSSQSIFSLATLVDNDEIAVKLSINDPGCYAYRQLTTSGIRFSVIEKITPTVSISTNDSLICSGERAIISGLRSDNVSNPVLSWIRDNVTIATVSGSGAIAYPATISGTYTLQMVANAQCNEGSLSVSNPVNITVSKLSGGVIDTAASTTAICKAGEGSILISNAFGNLVWESRPLLDPLASWQNDTVVKVASQNSGYTIPSLSIPTQYRAKLTSPVCSTVVYSDNTLDVTIDEPTKAGVASATDTLLCENNAVSLKLANYTGSKIKWLQSNDAITYTPINQLNSDPDDFPLTLDIITYGTRKYFKAKIKSGVCNLDSSNIIKITVCSENNLLPNALTPTSGDGNAFWDLSRIRLLPDATIQIFNRNGGLVYESTGQQYKSTPWDGGNLPAATYWYIIDRKDKSQILKGSVSIIK